MFHKTHFLTTDTNILAYKSLKQQPENRKYRDKSPPEPTFLTMWKKLA